MTPFRPVRFPGRRSSSPLPTLSPLAVALLLGACGGQAPDGSAVSPAASEIAPTLTPSAAQLAGDEVTTLHDAIVIAAAREAAEASTTSAPTIAAAIPDPVNVPASIDGPIDGPMPDIQSGTAPEAAPAVATTVVDAAAAPATIVPVGPVDPAPGAAAGTLDPAVGESSGQDATDVPGPTPEPASETAPTPAETSVPKTESTPDSVLQPESTREPVDKTEPAQGPVREAEPAQETVRETEPENEPVQEAEPAQEPVQEAEPAQEPVQEAEPEQEPVQEAESESGQEPVAESAPDTSGTDDVSSTPPADADTGAGDGSTPREFRSKRAEDFTGRVLDDGDVHVTWRAVDGATGYNVYRQGEFLASVPGAEIVDEDIVDRDYYYEIQAYFGNGDLDRIATGLTVKVRNTGRPDPDAVAPQTGFLDDYALIFSDEFDSGPLDAGKWNTRLLWGPDKTINSENQYYVDILNEPDFGYDPFTFEDGNLVIESVPVPDALRGKLSGNPDADELDYLSGIITSYDSLQFTYGYAEIRARVPFGQGYWPAFWLLNEKYDKDWPEIDIMEFIGDDEDVVYHTYHYYDDDHVLRSTRSVPTKGVDWTADFHTYAVDWRPGQIVYYVDDVEVHRVSDPKVSRENMYVIANTAMGGWWAGAPDETTPFPGRYEIDYIRVYRQIAPYEEPPLSDGASAIEPGDEVLGASPGHRAPFVP